jgi:hypothetical protein
MTVRELLGIIMDGVPEYLADAVLDGPLYPGEEVAGALHPYHLHQAPHLTNTVAITGKDADPNQTE